MNTSGMTIKNVKYAAFASDETACFEATVYWKGKRVFVARNDGRGGCDNFDPVKGSNWTEVERTVREIANEMYPRVAREYDEMKAKNEADNVQGSGWEDFSKAHKEQRVWRLPHDVVEEAVGSLLETHLMAKDLKRLMSKRIVVVSQGKLQQTGVISAQHIRVILADPAAKQKLDADIILNSLPFDEALELYRKHG